MNGFIREEFVKLYSLDLLEEMKEMCEKRFPGLKFPKVPEKGELELENVLESEYFFSWVLI